jgi:hypothetical protein
MYEGRRCQDIKYEPPKAAKFPLGGYGRVRGAEHPPIGGGPGGLPRKILNKYA